MPEQRAPSLWPELQGFCCCVVGSKINQCAVFVVGIQAGTVPNTGKIKPFAESTE
jgi:hypothetical protein